MSTEREQGTACQLDFDKLGGIAATGQQVVPVVLQHAETGDVLYVAYANRQAVEATLAEGRAVLWSTSRNELWRKGESSGDVLELVDVRINCDQNSVLYRVVPVGNGVCHTSGADGSARDTCYYRQVLSLDDLAFVDGLV